MRTFLATAHGGELEFMDHEAWRQFLIQNPGEVYINIGKNKRRKNRSNNQNAYYWGCILQLISDHTGESTEDLHDHFRVRFLMHGERFSRPKSTTSLTTSEFEDYMAKIRLFAQQDLNVFIPLPHEYLLTEAI